LREEIYDQVLQLLLDRLGYKEQPSELEEIAEDVADIAYELARDWEG
jgi:hypothetical protein